MKKIIKILIILILTFSLFSCNIDKNKSTTKPITEENNENNNLNETNNLIIDNEIHHNYIYFKVNDIYSEQYFNNEKINMINISILINYNNLLNLNDDYSKFVDNMIKENKSIDMIVSDTLIKYLSETDEFIYKVNKIDFITINNKKDFIIDARTNEELLLPIENNEIALFKIKKDLYLNNGNEIDDLLMIKRIQQRKMFYQIYITDLIFEKPFYYEGDCFLNNGDNKKLFIEFLYKYQLILNGDAKWNYLQINSIKNNLLKDKGE